MKWPVLVAAILVSVGAVPAQEQKPLKEAELLKQLDQLAPVARKDEPASGAPGNPVKKPLDPKSLTDSGTKTADDQPQKGTTEITCTKEATFDNKTRQAVFIGNVHVKDPQFALAADKLTAILRNTSSGKAAPGNPGTPAAASSPVKSNSTPGGGSGAGKGGSPDSGLEKAIAEGNVVIIQDKPGEEGGPPKRYIGKAERADYNATTGDVKLSGWPQVQQGINTQIATEASTVMFLNRDGRMRTQGASKTVIQEESEK